MSNKVPTGSKATPGDILRLLQENPQGLTRTRLRELCGATNSAEHFNRRIRDVRKLGWDYRIERVDATERRYILTEPRPVAAHDVSERVRAAVIHAANGRCQMCGRTVIEDHVKLQADHRIPLSWGGTSEASNLWGICEPCNRGKRNFFSSFDDEEMTEILAYESVYERIAYTLKRHFGEPVPADYLSFVANFNDYQEDWQKRLRELRYPVIGMKIPATTKKEGRRRRSFYTMKKWADLPPDHARLIKEFEKRPKPKRP